MRYGAIFLPGIITPAKIAFGRLLEEFRGGERLLLRDLAVYGGEEPPPNHSLELEVEAVLDAATESGFDRFHMVGYSAGGAVAAAVAARHGHRLISLALLEPAWLGNEGMSDKERQAYDEADAAAVLPLEQALPAFVRLNLAKGVTPPRPPDGEPPPWMAKRPAGIGAIVSAFRGADLDLAALRRLRSPVLYVLGRLSNPDLYEERSERARVLFSDFTLEVFEDRHHFDPPHLAEPERLAGILRSFWQRAESISG